MKKSTILLVLLFMSLPIFSQDAPAADPEAPKEGWTRAGNITVLFSQSAFNAEWQAGGVSNIAGNLGLNYDFNYKKADWNWDNKFIVAYGLTKNDDQEDAIKSDDRLEFNSLLGKEATKNWFYSVFMNFKTQMDVGYISETINDVEVIRRNSHFLSPAYLQFGPGMLWKKSDNLKVNIAPATSRLIFVHDEFTDPNDRRNLLKDGAFFGVESGETSRFEFGAALNFYYKFNIMKNVSMENILNLYSNYLDKPQNVDIDYTMNLVMTINKYLSTNLSFQTIYDDNAIGAFQVREVFGLGVNYGF